MTELKSYNGYYLWHYVPSLGASVVFLILFLAATVYHTWKIWRTRTLFCIAFAIGGLFEVIGFGGRAGAHSNTADLTSYSIQSVFILLGPILFAATVYMALGRLIRRIHAENHSLIRVNWLTKVFVSGDVLSFLLQGTGAGMMATGDLASLGKIVVMIGLVVQLVMFALFIISAVIFQHRMQKYPTHHASDSEIAWNKHLYNIYAACALIMIRSIFRVVEYGMGQDGYLLTHEWTLYIFDALLMFIVMVLYGMFFPSELQLGRPKSVDSSVPLGDAESI